MFDICSAVMFFLLLGVDTSPALFHFRGSCVWAQGNFQNPSGHGYEDTPDKHEWHKGAKIRVRRVGPSPGVQNLRKCPRCGNRDTYYILLQCCKGQNECKKFQMMKIATF